MQDVPAIAVSLDNYLARTEEQYDAAAQYTVALMKAVLGMLPPLPRQPSSSIASSSSGAAAPLPFSAARFAGHVLNVNVPKGSAADVLGYCLAHQGQHCHFPDFRVSLGSWDSALQHIAMVMGVPFSLCYFRCEWLPACLHQHPPAHLPACLPVRRRWRLTLTSRRGTPGLSPCAPSATLPAAYGGTSPPAATRGQWSRAGWQSHPSACAQVRGWVGGWVGGSWGLGAVGRRCSALSAAADPVSEMRRPPRPAPRAVQTCP